MVDMRAVAAGTSILLTLLVCGFQPGVTQQPDSSLTADSLKKLSIEQLMSVEVTSVSKRPERLTQAASAIQVITQDDIRRSGAATLAEALRLANNLQVAQLDSRQWAISARGFNGTAANKLLVLIDGRTVYTPLFSGVFWDVQEVPLADIDRIEVITGPGATLWGANAVNGVINVITKDAKDTQGFLLSGGGGTEQRGFGSVRYGAALGSRARARIYGRGFDRDATASPSGKDAADEWHLGQGGFRIDWDAASASRVTVQGDLYDGRIAQDSGGDIAVGGRNVMAKWSRTLSERSSLAAQVYYDRTHRDIPGLFGEDLDAYVLAGGPDFHSEEELAYELGYRHHQGSLALSVATFYSRYHGLRSLEQVNPPTPVPLVIGNGQDGESYGAELTAEYWLTNRWRARAGYTELRVHVWPNPGSTDMSKGATESQAPERQFLLQSWVDLPAHLGLAAWFRAIDDINNQLVPAYAELNATLTWQPTPKLDFSLVGQNLLHDQHREFGAPPATPTAPDLRRDIQRGVYGAVAWRF